MPSVLDQQYYTVGGTQYRRTKEDFDSIAIVAGLRKNYEHLTELTTRASSELEDFNAAYDELLVEYLSTGKNEKQARYLAAKDLKAQFGDESARRPELFLKVQRAQLEAQKLRAERRADAAKKQYMQVQGAIIDIKTDYGKTPPTMNPEQPSALEYKILNYGYEGGF